VVVQSPQLLAASVSEDAQPDGRRLARFPLSWEEVALDRRGFAGSREAFECPVLPFLGRASRMRRPGPEVAVEERYARFGAVPICAFAKHFRTLRCRGSG
jgi:hypothetical protein